MTRTILASLLVLTTCVGCANKKDKISPVVYTDAQFPAMPQDLRRVRPMAGAMLREGQQPLAALRMCVAEDRLKSVQHKRLVAWFDANRAVR